ncbi:MAG: hypothetical protein KDA47_09385, partial [Planctomycetales bacterium]|nr:hypothetical protein [Planctomycetales bacterium]
EADSLSAIVSTAIEAWEAAGISEAQSAALRSVEFQVTNLEDNLLGLAQGWIILLDQDAAGAGWFVDLTPHENDEFAVNSGGGWEAKENSAAAGRVDLLSVVTHELGHILGYDDLPALDGGDSLDVMIESISRGQRRLPNLAAVDEVFGGDF